MVRIDPRSSKPIYEQIVDSIKENILKGILKPGEKIPSVREMAKLITANPNTVSRAYMELERQKVIETFTGRGTFVSGSYKPKADEDRLLKLEKRVRDIVIEAHYMGISKKDLFDTIDRLFKEMERK